MPMTRTWMHIAVLARLAPAELGCLRRHVARRDPEEIAESLSLDVGAVVGAILRAQGKCRESRPWLRRPTLREVERDKRALPAGSTYTEALRSVDDDLLQDAREILSGLANREMVKHAPRSGGNPPAHTQTPERLREEWLERMTGGRENSATAPSWNVALVLADGRKHRGRRANP